jgi:hypothetical protein
MNGPVIYEAVKFWLPLLTVAGVLYRAYKKVTNGVQAWADCLLHNHLTHIQSSTQETVCVLKEVRDSQNTQAESITEVGKNILDVKQNITKVADDLADHINGDGQLQQQIATDLAILKDRQK